MKFSKFNQRLFGVIAVIAMCLTPAAASALSNNLSPQAPQVLKNAKAADVVPDQCVLLKQLNTSEQKYRLTENAPNTYTTTGTAYFNVKCGALSFSVPRGQDSLIDLTAAGELDCQAPNNVTTTTPTNGWCEGRFVVSTVNVLPNNTGRSDTFAWDSSNGGNFDWQANTLDQVGHATCPASRTTTAPCTYNVQLQGRLDNGATSLWVDDLTVKVDVTEGTVISTNVTP